MGDRAPFSTFGHLRYLWGNVPAFDVFNLPKNEGAAYDRDLNICFAGEFFFLQRRSSRNAGYGTVPDI